MRNPSLLAAPHRVGFFSGSLVLLAAMAWWAWVMVLRLTGVSLSSATPPAWLHADLMVFGFFPLFMLGFINTAGPKWLSVAAPAKAYWLGSIGLYASGSLLIALAGFIPPLHATGDALHLVAWAFAVWIWADRIRASAAADRRHAWLVLAAFVMALPALSCQLAASLYPAGPLAALWVQSAIQIGIWAFLLPVFLIVSHRMVPFFSSSVLQPYVAWRPFWLLYAWLLLALAHAGLSLAGWFDSRINSSLTDLVFAALLLYASYRWSLRRSFKVPLLAMLHAAFLWAGIALALYTAQGLAAWAGLYTGGLAPLHALTIGFFCCTLLGFVTRVSLGHSGRPLAVAKVTWMLYWLMHAVVLARIAGEFFTHQATLWFSVAAVAGLFTIAAWGWRYVPMYWQPRADGQPG
ncbi:uncharacterized protein involved in response to NO [Silvimonas terrae]|uniref:Uncharacterized protein involved in response to NO n=1 Tax=Silvimonas terrae TaxID=300266 RepID=A0A840RD25_9NEIS|nr:NnrS family protein [Silvimonas terrae]MBB5190171.1 uncharacterized protein involved in response to NO [Silvimonas terrae]